MYAHEYIYFFTKYEYFMYFLVNRFFAGSGPVHILGFAGSMTGPVPITLLRSDESKFLFIAVAPYGLIFQRESGKPLSVADVLYAMLSEPDHSSNW